MAPRALHRNVPRPAVARGGRPRTILLPSAVRGQSSGCRGRPGQAHRPRPRRRRSVTGPQSATAAVARPPVPAPADNTRRSPPQPAHNAPRPPRGDGVVQRAREGSVPSLWQGERWASGPASVPRRLHRQAAQAIRLVPCHGGRAGHRPSPAHRGARGAPPAVRQAARPPGRDDQRRRPGNGPPSAACSVPARRAPTWRSLPWSAAPRRASPRRCKRPRTSFTYCSR